MAKSDSRFRRQEDLLTKIDERSSASAASTEDLRRSLEALRKGPLSLTPGQKEAVQAQLAENREALLADMEQLMQKQTRAFQERESALTAKSNKEILDLKAQWEVFVNIDAAATARCLSCFDRRMQLQGSSTTMGTDGKTYLTRNPAQASFDSRAPAGGDKLPTVAFRGPHKPGTKAMLMGGAGAMLHQIRTHGVSRPEDIMTKTLNKAASLGSLHGSTSTTLDLPSVS